MKQLLRITFLLVYSTGFSQNDSIDTLKHLHKVKVLPVPAFGYTPETKSYVGAVCLFNLNLYQDSFTRTSNAKIEFNYSWNKQIILETEWNYFFKNEKWFTQGLLHFSKYPDRYYEIGANSADSSELLFQSNRIKLQGSILKQIEHKIFVGVGMKYMDYSKLTYFNELNTFTELKAQQSIGIKLIILRDNRNNLLSPTDGSYAELATSVNKSNSIYNQTTLDLRKYYSFNKSYRPVIALRFYQSSIFGSGPFYDISILGGDRMARGYFYGRFRDQHSTTIQVEYRMKIAWRFGLAVFGGSSLIYSNPAILKKANIKPNAGIGLRFLVDKKENTYLRFDYAIGNQGQNGFYVSFGESF